MTTVRERILKSARQHFKQAGAKGLRVQEICEGAGISRTSFYREFRNTDDVVATLAVRRWSQSLSEVIEQVGELAAPAERWATFVFSMAKRAAAEPEQFAAADGMLHVISLMYRDDGVHLHEIINVMRPCIEASQREGVVRTDVGVEEIADWLLRQIWSLSSVPFPGEEADEQLRQYIERFVMPGLLKPHSESILPRQMLAEIGKLGQALERIETRIGGPV